MVTTRAVGTPYQARIFERRFYWLRRSADREALRVNRKAILLNPMPWLAEVERTPAPWY